MDPMLPMLYQIQRVMRETHDTFTLELAPQNGGISIFQPGQFNMLYVFGTGEIPISICGNPERPDRLMHTTRAVGIVTKALGRLKKGDLIGVRGPFGNPWPLEEAEGKDVVAIAGGIGLAPLRPVLYQLLSHRDRYSRVILLYGARTPEDVLYKKEIERWRFSFDGKGYSTPSWFSVHVTVDRATSGWKGNVGVVTTLIPRAPFDPDQTIAMVCGPEVMMRFTVMELMKRGVKPENIFISMERNMKCAVGFCGHCQFGPQFICKDGPVFRYDRIQWIFGKREI